MASLSVTAMTLLFVMPKASIMRGQRFGPGTAVSFCRDRTHVRVCGFSARFVAFSKRWQDEVIARHRLR